MNTQRAEKKTSAGATAERPIVVRSARPLTEDDLRLMRVPERFWGSSIDQVSDGKHKTVALTYIRRLTEAISRGGGLLLWGDNGVGKTALAVVIQKQARRMGFTGLFIRSADLLRADMNKQWFDSTHTQTVYERARSVDLLVLDDMGKEHHAPSGYAAGYAPDMLEDLVRDRSSRLRSMIVTTNMTPTEIKSDSIYKGSMSEILKGSTMALKFTGPDHREAEKDDLKKMLGGDDL